VVWESVGSLAATPDELLSVLGDAALDGERSALPDPVELAVEPLAAAFADTGEVEPATTTAPAPDESEEEIVGTVSVDTAEVRSVWTGVAVVTVVLITVGAVTVTAGAVASVVVIVVETGCITGVEVTVVVVVVTGWATVPVLTVVVVLGSELIGCTLCGWAEVVSEAEVELESDDVGCVEVGGEPVEAVPTSPAVCAAGARDESPAAPTAGLTVGAAATGLGCATEGIGAAGWVESVTTGALASAVASARAAPEEE
jgi:hypothetical protein